ncbi:hypothetical protein [Lederbergia galactosidilytica]|uniref:Uncharacterized protein n=1 Tax=Lederbergia galactosidilytica TaxID=217031 RepID=A0A177ZM37_9BACI|nr:hypothetical protein [Lederbergia galactosidilytica]MBP1917289.1 hypothetical protein [Lederbergia galactosidilytica]OAK69006.1 hypothetical protein ABB05_14585 [Lederbergia galactosidilytica]
MGNKVRPPKIMIPVSGKDQIMAAPFVGMWELAYISPNIEVGRGIYKLLAIYSGRSDKIAADHFYKFHIFDSESKIVRSEDIAEYCMKVYLTFYTIMISRDDIKHTLKTGGASLQGIRESLDKIRIAMIRGYEQEFGKQHKLFQNINDILVYIDQQKILEEKMYDYAVRIQTIKSEIEKVGSIPEKTFLHLLQVTSKFKTYARQRGILLMQHQNKLRLVRSLLKDTMMVKYLSDDERELTTEIIKQISTEIEYQQIVFHSHSKTLITPKGYIRKLQQVPEDFIRLKANEFVRGKWIINRQKHRFTWFKNDRKVD